MPVIDVAENAPGLITLTTPNLEETVDFFRRLMDLQPVESGDQVFLTWREVPILSLTDHTFEAFVIGFGTDDLHESVARARSLGAHAEDTGMVADPNNVPFLLMQTPAFFAVGEAGTMVWLEYSSPEPPVGFYRELFGWRMDDEQSDNITIAHVEDTAIGWFWQLNRPDSVWVPYFGVVDLDAALANVDQKYVLQTPSNSFLGPTAVLTTPGGAEFGLVQLFVVGGDDHGSGVPQS